MSDLRHGKITTQLGELTLVATDADELAALYFPAHPHMPTELGNRVDVAEDEFLQAVKEQLDEFLAGTRQEFSIRLNPQGNEFSQQVWALLQLIPYGSTTTYGELASQMGNRHLAQRVGQVVGRNPISIIIPCHRVVGADGTLTGYAGGLSRKRFLLELEEPADVAAARLF